MLDEVQAVLTCELMSCCLSQQRLHSGQCTLPCISIGKHLYGLFRSCTKELAVHMIHTRENNFNVVQLSLPW